MNLKTLWFVVRKNLTRNLVVLSLVALAVGSGALVIIPMNGIMDGFLQSFFATTIDVSTGHVVVTPPKGSKHLDDPEKIRERISSVPEVKAASIRLQDRVFLSKGDKTEATLVTGIDPKNEGSVVILPEKISEGVYLKDDDSRAALVGKELASALDVKIGDEVGLLLANGKRASFTVKGIYSTGYQQLDKQAYVQRSDLKRLTAVGDKASEIVVKLDSLEKTDDARKKIDDLGIDAKVETWKDRIGFVEGMRNNFNIIQRFIILLALIASCITIAVLMYTNVEHRIKSIGVLKAIGSPNRGILQIFVLEGLIIGIIGVAVGETIGGLITWYLSNHPLRFTIGVSGGSANEVAVKAVFGYNLLILPAAIIIPMAFLASLYPAWRAARTNIIEAVWRA
ncbi:MAG: ABC transporter permease [Actinobacteria bacterium]|nr:ABC transporter permease [Actinomycetota bacterium]